MASVVRYTGLNPQVVEIQEASAGSANDFYDGDCILTDGSGEIVIATAGAISGIAQKAATGTASTKIPVELLDFHEIYVARYKAAAIGETLIGDILDFTFTAGAHTLDESGANTDVYCVGTHPEDGTDTSGRLLVRFLIALGTGMS